MGERLVLDAHADELRVERELRDPIDGHAVAALAGTRARARRARSASSRAPVGGACRTPRGRDRRAPGRRFPAGRAWAFSSEAMHGCRCGVARASAARSASRRRPTCEREVERGPHRGLGRPHRGRAGAPRGHRRARRRAPAVAARGTTSSTKPRAERVGGGDAFAGDDRGERGAGADDTRQRLARTARREHADARLRAARRRSRRPRVRKSHCSASSKPKPTALPCIDAIIGTGTAAQETPHVASPARVAHREQRRRRAELAEVGAGGEVVARRGEHDDAHVGVGDDRGEHLAERVARRDVVDVDRWMVELDLGDARRGACTCEAAVSHRVAPARADDRPRLRATPARSRRAASVSRCTAVSARRPARRPDRRPTCGRGGAGRGAPPSPRGPRPRARSRDGRRSANAATEHGPARRAGVEAGVGEHPRRVARRRAGRRRRRAPAKRSRSARRRGRAPNAPGPRTRSSRSGNGSGRRGVLDLHHRARRAGAARGPTSGVAHAVPSTTTVAPATDGGRATRERGSGAAGAARTADRGQQPRRGLGVDRVGRRARASVGPRRAGGRGRAEGHGHVDERRPRGRRARVHPAVGGAQQRRGRRPGGRPPAAPRQEVGAGTAPRRARRGPEAVGEVGELATRRGATPEPARRAALQAHRAGEARGSLLEERGDALGAVVGRRDQQVEVGLEAQRVGEREVAAALHRVAGRRLRARRALRRAARRARRRTRTGSSSSTASPRRAERVGVDRRRRPRACRSASDDARRARVSRCVPPQHGSSPAPTSGNAIVASGPMIRRSAASSELGAGADRRTVPHRDRRRRERRRRSAAGSRKPDAACGTRGSRAPTPSSARSSSARGGSTARSSSSASSRPHGAARRRRPAARATARWPRRASMTRLRLSRRRAASASTSARSASVSAQAVVAAAFARTCSGDVAPAMTLPTAGVPASHESASSGSVCPCVLRVLGERARRRRSARRWRSARRIVPHAARREPSGCSSPRRYLPVSIPLASGK